MKIPVLASVTLLAASLITPNAYADLITFNATFSGGLHGVGSFNLNETCVFCDKDTGLEEFTFLIGEHVIKGDSFTYFAGDNSLSGSLNVGKDHVVFTPSGQVHYAYQAGRNREVLHGEYHVDAGASIGPDQAEALSTTLIANPEPSSVLLLGSAFAITIVLISRKRRRI